MPIPGLPNAMLSATIPHSPLTGLGGYGDDPLSDEDASRMQANLSVTRPAIFSRHELDVRAFTAAFTQLCFPRCSPSLPFWPGRPAEPSFFCFFRKSVFVFLFPPLPISPLALVTVPFF